MGVEYIPGADGVGPQQSRVSLGDVNSWLLRTWHWITSPPVLGLEVGDCFCQLFFIWPLFSVSMRSVHFEAVDEVKFSLSSDLRLRGHFSAELSIFPLAANSGNVSLRK